MPLNRHKWILLSFAGLTLSLSLNGDTKSKWLSTQIPSAEEVGSAEVSYIFWDLYEVELYAPNGAYTENSSFALSLRYQREIKADRILKSSMDEMRRMGADEVKLAQWYDLLKGIFPDVSKGDTLTGIFQPGQPTHFYYDDVLIGTIPDPAFGHHFSQIWLGPEARYPEVRQALKGAS